MSFILIVTLAACCGLIWWNMRLRDDLAGARWQAKNWRSRAERNDPSRTLYLTDADRLQLERAIDSAKLVPFRGVDMGGKHRRPCAGEVVHLPFHGKVNVSDRPGAEL